MTKMFYDIETAGIKPGEMFVISAGRQYGKSTYYKMLSNPTIKVLSQSIVDGDNWYTVTVPRDASIWIREHYQSQENKQWFENIDSTWHLNFNTFDVHEELYTLLLLRWA